MENKVTYFAYGANRDPRMMAWITGNENLIPKPAVLEGFTLCVQRLDQVPDTPFPTSPVPLSPRGILKQSWPDTFTTYIIKEDPKGKVAGNIYELTLLERELVRDWEMIDYGWYKDYRGKAKIQEGREVDVQIEGLREGQEVDREIDGMDYETWLNPPEDFKRVAEKSRREYFERMGLVLEGKARSGIENKP